MGQVIDLDKIKEVRHGKKIKQKHFIEDFNSSDLLILSSASDIGVQRNFGRLGSRLAPKAILTQLLNLLQKIGGGGVFVQKISDQVEELKDFEGSTSQSVLHVKSLLQQLTPAKLCHIGGGHDHIYTLLSGLLESGCDDFSIINIDPHCDTRVEQHAHSGNPFRRFIEKYPQWKGRLIQVGTSLHSNTDESLEGLGEKMQLIDYESLTVQTAGFQSPFNLLNEEERQRPLVVSLDADVIEAGIMQAVSSVSYHGIPAVFLRQQLEHIYQAQQAQVWLGIYEYNPLYDDLSCKGARYLAGLIYDYWMASASDKSKSAKFSTSKSSKNL